MMLILAANRYTSRTLARPTTANAKLTIVSMSVRYLVFIGNALVLLARMIMIIKTTSVVATLA